MSAVDVIVLGAGFVGVSAALHLQQRGRSVTLVDRLGAPGMETSFGNAGIVQSEAVFPYTFPRNPFEVAKAAFNLDPRAHVRWTSVPAITPFLWRYFLASSPKSRLATAKGMRSLVASATAEHLAFAEPAGAMPLLREGGWIKVFRTQHGQDIGFEEVEELKPYGVESRMLTRAQLLELEPHVSELAISGAQFTQPLSTSNPQGLVQAYADLFVKRGGRLVKGEAASLQSAGAGWSVKAEAETIEGREVVVALGAGSDPLLRALGYRLPFGVKRGYHMHYASRGNAGVSRPVLDYEKGYVVTPMAAGIRLTTGAEFARPDDPPSDAHLRRVEPYAREMFPIAERRDAQPWMGKRPCLPDMMPVIGAGAKHKGLWFDFGHQHLGLTLGPASGRLLAEMMTGEPTFVDPTPFRAERFA